MRSSQVWKTHYEKALQAGRKHNFEKAEKLFQETLVSIGRDHGADHPAVSQTLAGYAVMLKQQNRFDEYAGNMQRAYAFLGRYTDTETKALLGNYDFRVDREALARKLGDFFWDQRNYEESYTWYRRAIEAVPGLDTSESSKNLRLAFTSAGAMKTACELGKTEEAEAAMKELKARFEEVNQRSQNELEYWIRTGGARLDAGQC